MCISSSAGQIAVQVCVWLPDEYPMHILNVFIRVSLRQPPLPL